MIPILVQVGKILLIDLGREIITSIFKHSKRAKERVKKRAIPADKTEA